MGAAVTLVVGMSVPSYATTSPGKACNGTHAAAVSDAHEGATYLYSGSTYNQCGTLGARSYYIYAPSGTRYWSTWVKDGADAEWAPGSEYSITKTESYTAYNATWTTTT